MAFKLLTNPDARRFMYGAWGYACRVFASQCALEVTCVRVCRAVWGVGLQQVMDSSLTRWDRGFEVQLSATHCL